MWLSDLASSLPSSSLRGPCSFVSLLMDWGIGRGVFASKDIPGRTVLEVSPVLVLDPVENEEHVKKTMLFNYT